MKHKVLMNLQLFADAVHGKKIVYLFRVMSNSATTDGQVIAFTTENSLTESKDSDTVATKDGVIRVPGALEIEISATSILTRDGTLFNDLRNAMRNDEKIEIWRTNLDKPGTDANEGKYSAEYYVGYLTEFEETANAEDLAEVSTTFGVEGNGLLNQWATVSAENQAIADYVFKDTGATGA